MFLHNRVWLFVSFEVSEVTFWILIRKKKKDGIVGKAILWYAESRHLEKEFISGKNKEEEEEKFDFSDWLNDQMFVFASDKNWKSRELKFLPSRLYISIRMNEKVIFESRLRKFETFEWDLHVFSKKLCNYK